MTAAEREVRNELRFVGVIRLLVGNFLYEQRWAILALLLYGIGMAGTLALGGEPEPADLVFYARQQGTLGALFGVFLISAAVHNDLRSRRVLMIVSKAVARWQYLAGVALGGAVVSTGFLLLAGAMLIWIEPAGFAVAGRLLLAFWPVALLAICLSLCFSAVLHPFVANAITLAIVAVLIAAGTLAQGAARLLLPGAGLYGSSAAASSAWLSGIAALIDSLAAFALACWIFSRRDLGGNIE